MNAADFLAEVSLFSNFRKEDLQRLAKKSRSCFFKIGDVIINEGERDGRLFILISGRVEVIKSYRTPKAKRLRTLTAPCYIGEMALIDDMLRSATVVAKGNVRALCLDHWNLREEIEKYPALALELLRTLYRRFIALEKIMVDSFGGFIPICSACKRIRDGKGEWLSIERYLMMHTEHEFSHGICPECRKHLYPELLEEE
ncbi:MAG: cyclic nucleotide-binding domain-containing protein [Desulfobacterales bacterium]|nr:MAG: cyclic nucleotide-binding domain-containing protein [Desulfobacterales bacterium]